MATWLLLTYRIPWFSFGFSTFYRPSGLPAQLVESIHSSGMLWECVDDSGYRQELTR